MNYWWTSDTHFFHKNILKYCNRPFKTVEEMNERIIYNWNKNVKHEDIIFFLGDLAFGSEKVIAGILYELNGNIKILFGNHDKTLRKFAKMDIKSHPILWERIEFFGDYLETSVLGQRITMTHYSMKIWNGSHRGSWNLFGHSHGNLPDDPNSLSFDCGVDCHNFTPINFKQVKDIMNKKTFIPIDHHK